MEFSRRAISKLVSFGPVIILSANSSSVMGRGLNSFAADGKTVEAWMDEWKNHGKEPVNGLFVSRFADPIYFLTRSITWKPNPGEDDVQIVTVPVGFVTDFASIPRVFWSALRPDGNYAWAAVVHDYLYWTQTTSRQTADTTLLDAMDDFDIPAVTKTAIYEAVHWFGAEAWMDNARLKEDGEKRILRRFPNDPRVTWEGWKKLPENFE